MSALADAWRVRDCERNRARFHPGGDLDKYPELEEHYIGRVFTVPHAGFLLQPIRYSDEERARIEKWVELGHKNLWIRHAYDPPFDRTSLARVGSIEELESFITRTNWSLGVGFWYENLCFINQINGGDEFLVIRDDIPFESITGRYFKGQKLRDFIRRVQAATPEQLRLLDY